VIEIYPSKTLTVTVACPPEQVYAFVSNPERLPHWATGLCKAVSRVGDEWIAETADGEVRVRFADPNQYGVLDHVVILPSRESVHVPMRVVPNGAGSEVLFTLFQLPGMTDDKFAEDAEMVRRDLLALKQLLER
jgi:hypothetical protein